MGMRPSISVAIAGLLCFSAYVSAQTNKQLYELQERCGKRAAEVFKREYSPAHGQMTFNYENHYSARLNKCFFTSHEARHAMRRSSLFIARHSHWRDPINACGCR